MVTFSDRISVSADSPRPTGTLYLHYPCFDGLVSASIAWDFLETTKRWNIARFVGVNYDRLGDWIRTPLPPSSAVVDFLYHPDAVFWADHHGTTFVTPQTASVLAAETADRLVLYDRDSPSCAMLLFNQLQAGLSDRSRYAEMAALADKIDSANYESVDEAVYGSHPAMLISLSLAVADGAEYGDYLLRSLRTMTLADVASLPEVQAHVADAHRRMAAGLQSVREGSKMELGEIAVVIATQINDALVNRYSPYLIFPDARYSVALVHSPSGSKITAMRNPWRNFESVDLGSIFVRYGGGGHRRVASVVITNSAVTDPQETLYDIVSEIRAADAATLNSERLKTA